MRPELHIDFETRSAVDLKVAGLPNYAAHETTDLWCACWTLVDPEWDTEWEGTWLRGDDPAELLAILRQKPKLFAHNAGFEHALWRGQLAPRYGVPAPEDFDAWTCTAAMAAAMALPRDLARAARVMGLDVQKDAEGRRLMLQMCKPRKVEPLTWWDQPEKLERLADYCATDVRVEHGLARALRPLMESERRIWRLDHVINERGVQVDLDAVRHAQVIAKAEQARLAEEMALATHHAVRTVTHPQSIAAWLRQQGVDVESLNKGHIKDLLADPELTEPVKKVVRIRDEARRSSVAKLDAFEARTSADGRLRQHLLYHGASTGRWTGTGVQLQNLMRPWMKYPDIELAIRMLEGEHAGLLALMFGETALDVIANCMRSFIIAAPGHELVMADFSNIEGRVLAWLAGEDWKLDAFRSYDAGTGPDLYVLAVCKIMGLTPEQVDDDFLRQIGKVVELSLGFGGGHGAFVNMAGNYGLKPSMIASTIHDTTDAEVWERAEWLWEEDNRYNLPALEWTALRVTIDGWRAAHPALCRKPSEDGDRGGFWAQLESAAFDAVRNPGRAFHAGKVTFLSFKTMLYLRLPSGRYLMYAEPSIREVDTPWGDKRLAVTFMGLHQVTKQWTRQNSYGGFWSQQVTQAAARDLMADAMARVEGRGWPVVLTVHDEVVSEVRSGAVSGEAYGEELCVLPAWALGLPVTAKGAVSPRYRK